ncbi:hypothetical protein ADICEAN_03494 [Cesiribacter andamanensis AMV16]|uniref:Uncharacterized protein n=2 Tax=Cesiribacter TaxID=1133570 RepID=M7MY68_9BACT|nr:hypothetical protein ADICEAN_03494 [Cesiribacter andamanensis AMV16]
MRHAESIVRGILDNRVRQATEGLYSSEFDRIELSYTSKDLIIHNLRFYPDSTQLQDAQGNQLELASAYDILIPELRIEGIALRRAYLEKELKLDRLHIGRPQIKLFVDFDKNALSADSLLKQDINKRLAPFFKAIYAQKVELEGGQIDLRTTKNGRRSHIKTTMQLEAWQLAVKTALQPQDRNWLDVERFLFGTGTALGYLADDTYQLRLNGISASSADSSFFIQGFQLLPTADVPSLLLRKPDLDHIYTIRIPQLYTYGLNFDALYNQQNFLASEITLFSPSLQLYDAKARPSGEKENFRPEDLYPVIEKVLNQIAVAKINVRHGRAMVRNREESYLTNFSVSIREALVHNFKIDSAARYQKDKLFFADSLQVRLRNYQLRLSDNLHLLRADELDINSNHSSISAKNLRLEPDTLSRLQKNSAALYQVAVPDLQLSGINLHELYNNNQLQIDSLLVSSPTVRYTRQSLAEKKEQKGENAFKQEDLYGLISDYLYSLHINRLSIDSGTVSLNKTISDSVEVFTTRVQYAHLWNLLIDSTSAYRLNKLFYADNFDLRISDYKHQLPDGIHQVEARSIDISTLKDHILLTGVRLYNLPGHRYPFPQVQHQQTPTLLLIDVPRLELNGVDILNAYLTKKLEVQQVLMPSPTLHIASRLKKKEQNEREIISSRALYDLISDFSESVNVQNLRLTDAEILTAFYAPNGLLQLNSSNASVSIDNFRFDSYTSQNPKRLFFADAVTVTARDFMADLPDRRYQIRADELLASTATNSVVAEGVRLQQPEQGLSEQELLLQGKKGLLSFSLPRVRLTGLDFDKAYYQDHLQIDSILAEAPQLSYYQFSRRARERRRSSSPTTILPQTSLYESLSPFLQHLSVKHLRLQEGTIRTTASRRGESVESLFLDKISISVSDFVVDSSAESNTQRFFYSEDVQVHIGKYLWNLPDREHQVTASNLHLSTLNNLIRASSVKLEPVPGAPLTDTDDRYHILVPEVVMVGIPFDDIFEKEEFRLQKLDLITPDIEIRQYRSGQAAEISRRDRSLPELLSAGFNLVQVEDASITDGRLRYVRYGSGAPVDMQFPQLKARLSNFSIRGGRSLADPRPFFSDNLEVIISNWKRLLPDSLHWLEAGSLYFSAKDSLFRASQLRVYPDLAIPARPGKAQLRAAVPELLVSGLDYQKLSSDSLVMRSLEIMRPHIDLLQPAQKEEKGSTRGAAASPPAALMSLIASDSIVLRQGTLVLRSPSATDTSRLELNNIYVTAAGFHYDSLQQHNSERLLYSDYLVAGLKNYKAQLGGGFYEIEAKEVGISSTSSTLWADSIRITPTMDRATFARRKGIETDQYVFRNRRLEVQNLDLRKLVYDKSIEADRLLVDGFALFLYRDKRQPYPENRRPKMPQELMRNSSWKINIGQIDFTSGYIAYSEQVKGAREAGFVDLTQVEAHANTLTNHPARLQAGHITNFTFQARLMGEGSLKAHFEIPMGDTLNRHKYWGSLEGMPLSAFNPMLEKTSALSIRSGEVDHITFQVEADKESAAGSMEFGYDNLKVSLVNKRTGKPGGLFHRVGSAVANAFVHSSNTALNEDEALRKGKIEYERDEQRSIVNYWVKTLMDGFKSSIGL